MRIGITVPNFGPAATADSLRAWAAVVEDAGFDFLMVGDHVAATPDVTAAYPGPFWEPLTLLGYLAGVTRRVELGTTVLVVPYRDPLLTARSLAGLDQLSDGRLIVGVGVGWATDEFAALGLDPQRRGEVTDEYLRALLALWSDDVVSFHGRWVAFTDVDSRPRPRRRPHPPVWVGGNGAAARRRAVALGQAWHPLRVPVGWLRATGLPGLRAAAEEAGRPAPALAPRVVLHPTAEWRPDDDRLLGEGRPDQIRADLDELRALGATHVLLDTHRDAVTAARDDHDAQRALVEDAAGWLA
ncbi:TIGR03619 family F420-dependent LLM class oxidoreductase [Actinomycetospora lemnae]|uniref:TIGR03619 family F420-dependent LLM class oxidoreductase n=1 Tax=Actinomycetospora lemnae TaxID=3019891 RepID=A0ABT5SXN4_9PSEU|nr:TIGR03619 family F420-dependent LLM class oxidoreductase [Actinomycetospora sp. DW7H6]MDD7966483.1 TIGR03619 family F420-dependent LLM class oxidoreductase [Actinomycetospora sp. DW7H6]